MILFFTKCFKTSLLKDVVWSDDPSYTVKMKRLDKEPSKIKTNAQPSYFRKFQILTTGEPSLNLDHSCYKSIVLFGYSFRNTYIPAEDLP